MGFLVRMYARLAARLRPPFVTVRADDGSVVMMDQRTVDFLESEEPLPTQASLNLLLHGVTRLNITKVGEGTTLLDVPDREALASLADCLRIDEPSERFHCMCIGDENLTFDGPEGRRGVITLHHGQSIRWDGIWGSDAMLSEPIRLLSWLAERGLDAPLRAYEEERGEAEQAELQWQTWVDTAPDVISSLLPDLANAYVFGPGEADPMLQMLDRARADLLEASADEGKAVMALLAWYGRGAGPWSGYPAYEDIPLLLLQSFPATSIVMALETYAVRLEHLEGGARFFQSRSKASLVPLELRRRLLEHVRATPFPDNVVRAEHALGG